MFLGLTKSTYICAAIAELTVLGLAQLIFVKVRRAFE